MNRHTIRDLWRLAWSQRWVVLVPALLGLLTLSVYAAAQDDVYQARVVLMAPLGKPSDRYIRSAVSAGAREMLRAAQTRLLSFDLLRRVVVHNQLYPGVRASRGGIEKAVQRLRKNLDVMVDGRGQTIEITMRHSAGPDPGQTAAKVANNLAEIFLEDQRTAVDQGASEVKDFVSKQEKTLRAELEAAEQALAKFQAEHHLELPEHREANLALIRAENQRIEQYLARQQQITDERNSYNVRAFEIKRRIKDAQRLVGEDDEVTVMLRRYIRNLELDLVRLQGEFEEDSVVVIQKKEELAAAKTRLEELPSTSKGNEKETVEFYQWMLTTLDDHKEQLRNEWTLCEQRIAEGRKEIDAARARIDKSTSLYLEYTRLQRAVEDTRNRRRAMLTKSEEAELAVDYNTYDQATPIVIEQRAFPSGIPIGPDRLRMSLLGLGLGLAIGAGLAFLRVRLDDSVHRDSDLKALLPGTIIVTLPEVAGGGQKSLRVLANVIGWLLVGALGAAALVVLAVSNGWWGDPEMIAPLLKLFH